MRSDARKQAEEALARWSLCDPSRYNELRDELEAVYVCADDLAIALRSLLAEQDGARAELHFVCADFPGPGNECVFVECEDGKGRGVNAGEWVRRPDGLVALVVKAPAPSPASDEVREAAEAVSQTYYEIAAEAIGEDGVRAEFARRFEERIAKRRAAALAARGERGE